MNLRTPRRTAVVAAVIVNVLAGCGGSPAPETSSAGASPTPAITAAPTAAPGTPTVPATPTSAPATGTPSPAATASAPASAPATAGAAATACDHPYWPLRTGATWTSGNGAGGTNVVTITQVAVGADGATATQQTVSGASTITQQLTCDASGIQFGDATFHLANGHTGTRTTIDRVGALLPPAAALVDGATFSYSTRSSLDFPAFDAQGAYTGQSTYEIDLAFDCTVAGPQSITVAAGTLNGVKITCNGTSTRIDSNGTSKVTDLNDSSTYFLENVGPSGVDPASQLMSYSIPAAP